MCCFSRPIEHVSNTRIFARDSGLEKQFLVYEMKFSANQDLAMILPIPVPMHTADSAVRFINLEKYPEFFKAMESGFPKPPPAGGLGRGGLGGDTKAGGPPLVVANVGSFEASFVPSIEDFDRLDERFRLPPGAWDDLPQYRHYGFAVFKFKKNATKVHPMAFEFPRTNQTLRLFFPTLHIHDGKVHETAHFDHTLYLQYAIGSLDGFEDWKESPRPAGMFLKIARCQGLVEENAHVYKREIIGERRNEDILA